MEGSLVSTQGFIRAKTYCGDPLGSGHLLAKARACRSEHQVDSLRTLGNL